MEDWENEKGLSTEFSKWNAEHMSHIRLMWPLITPHMSAFIAPYVSLSLWPLWPQMQSTEEHWTELKSPSSSLKTQSLKMNWIGSVLPIALMFLTCSTVFIGGCAMLGWLFSVWFSYKYSSCTPGTETFTSWGECMRGRGSRWRSCWCQW